MSSCSASTADAPEAAGWSSTGCSNSPLPTSRYATRTLSPPSGPGRCRPRRPRRAGTRRAWIALQRTAPGELPARMGPVKWIPQISENEGRPDASFDGRESRVSSEGCTGVISLPKGRKEGHPVNGEVGTWFGAFRIPNLLPRSLVNIVGCSSRGRGNCGKLRAISNRASKPVIRSFPSAVRTVEKQLRALASSPPELLVFPRFA